MGEAVIDWEWVSGDPAGNVTFERYGNGLSTSRGYQQGTYRPSSIASFAGARIFLGPLGTSDLNSLEKLGVVVSRLGG